MRLRELYKFAEQVHRNQDSNCTTKSPLNYNSFCVVDWYASLSKLKGIY